jgi:diacylglycerol kinase (ATP)
VSRRVHVIVNPFAGTRRGPGTPDGKATLARAVIASAGAVGEVTITTSADHARQVAAAAAASGVDVVAAWGGDGTMHGVARALVGTPAALALVAQGSGNGLARELGVPLDPAGALTLAATGPLRRIDAGLLAGEPFFNVAGIGLDARVAHAFASTTGRRGLLRYVHLVTRELAGYRPLTCRLEIEGAAQGARRVLMVSVANSRQYGNNARIAPRARLDDGLIDLVLVGVLPLWRIARRLPALFSGGLGPEPGLEMHAVRRAALIVDGPVDAHVDGEPRRLSGRIDVAVVPGALTVVAPAEGAFGDQPYAKAK